MKTKTKTKTKTIKETTFENTTIKETCTIVYTDDVVTNIQYEGHDVLWFVIPALFLIFILIVSLLVRD